MTPGTKVDPLSATLQSSREYFERSTRVLEEKDSAFAPQPGMMTAAQQVAHTAMTIDWFIEGASRPEGFDLDFETHAKIVGQVTSLAAARAWLEKSYEKALEFAQSLTPDRLASPLPPGPVMGGAPLASIFEGITDHTAHHRGALTVYSRMLGKVPLMPYAE